MEKQDDFVWCLHCERPYRYEKWVANKKECPNCGASMFMDGWNWSFLVENVGYPEIPEEGKYYPLYPPKDGD